MPKSKSSKKLKWKGGTLVPAPKKKKSGLSKLKSFFGSRRSKRATKKRIKGFNF